MTYLVVYLTGLLFGLGIMISGMANPAKVINFFDVFGTWDPSLAFVMGGALLTTLIGYRIVLARARPWLSPRFHLPTNTAIDARLVAGAAIFGIGWGIAGFCPGGALPAIGTGRVDVALFVVAMIAGILTTRAILENRAKAAAATSRTN